MAEDREDTTVYKVVLNHEEQYSIWPAHRENALGWKDAGKSGTTEECLAYIKEVWTDMRPLSLRLKMQEQWPGLGAAIKAIEDLAGSREFHPGAEPCFANVS